MRDDLLLYDALQGEIDGVLLPRPELLEQAYILAPMAEIAPELVLPGTTSTISQLLQAFTGDRDGMRMIEFSWRGESLPRL